MEYIIFLLTIQMPFLYFIWKIFQKHSFEVKKDLQHLKKQNEHTANFMDTLRMSVEKISEDIYGKGNGKVNSRMFQIEKDFKELRQCFRQMELYTGLNTSSESLESSLSGLKDKDFV